MLLNKGTNTILLYNWPKVFTAAKGDATECVRIFKMLTNNEIPKNKYDPIFNYSGLSFIGKSFLVHPEVLLYNRYKYRDKDLSIYLALAAIRPLSHYTEEGITTLPLLHAPVHPHDYLEDPRLLWIDNRSNIHFLYEDTPQEAERH